MIIHAFDQILLRARHVSGGPRPKFSQTCALLSLILSFTYYKLCYFISLIQVFSKLYQIILGFCVILYHIAFLFSLAFIIMYLWNYSICIYFLLLECKFFKDDECVSFHMTLIHLGDFPGGLVVESPPASAGDTDLIPGAGESHMLQGSWACMPQLLSWRAAAAEAHEP